MRFLGYPIYKILFALLVGIVLQRYLTMPLGIALYVAVGSFLFLVLCFFKLFTYPVQKVIFLIATIVFFVAFGFVNTALRAPSYKANHYVHTTYEQGTFLELVLSQELPPNGFSNRFYAHVTQLDDKKVSGKVLFQLPIADSLHVAPGNTLHLATAIEPVAIERNPSDFNYQEYLAGIDVYGRVYGSKALILQVINHTNGTSGFQQFKSILQKRLKESSLQEQPRAFVEALLLGKRENIDPEVNNSFRDAGVIHILALSGLHVGVLLLILSFLTSWLHRFKYGRFIQSVLLVTLLWLFGILTGLSPSIMRAVTMFSFVAVAMNINRSTSVLHSLALSAFVLLVANPKLLFQVGFQLSYVAVIAIVTIQPILASMWRPRSWFPKYMWNVLTVTLAAQIGVAPISLFYFHQFPGLFLLGNLILLPVMPIILGACLLFIVLVLTQAPSDWLAVVLNNTFRFYIDAVAWISEARGFIITDVYLTKTELFLIYGFLISIVLFFNKVVRKSRLERAALIRPNYGLHAALTFLCAYFVVIGLQDDGKEKKFVVLHQSVGTAVAVIENKQAVLFTDLHIMDDAGMQKSKERLLSSTIFHKKKVNHTEIKNLLQWKEHTLLVVGNDGLYVTDVESPTVLLSHSPQIHLDRLLDDLQPKHVIADGSNFKQSIAQWKKTCERRNIPFTSTYEKGAIILGD